MVLRRWRVQVACPNCETRRNGYITVDFDKDGNVPVQWDCAGCGKQVIAWSVIHLAEVPLLPQLKKLEVKSHDKN
jgi:hypothetical protein